MIRKVPVFLQKLHKKLPVLLCDISAIPIAWYAAYWLRYNMHPFPKILTSTHSLIGLTLITVIQVFCFFILEHTEVCGAFSH